MLTCSYCDLEEVERLAGLLLERLSQASANKHPHKNSDLNTVHMKNAMLTTLNVAHPDTENYSFGRCLPLAEPRGTPPLFCTV